MNYHVIQFGNLEGFVEEPLEQGSVIRITILDISKGISKELPQLRQVEIGVHIRTINHLQQILACYLPVATIQLYNGRREDDPLWQRYDEAWHEAELLKQQVMTFIQEKLQGKGIRVFGTGVIELGTIQFLKATWQPQLEKNGRTS